MTEEKPRDDEFPIIFEYLAVLRRLDLETNPKKAILLRCKAKQLRKRMTCGVERRALKAAIKQREGVLT